MFARCKNLVQLVSKTDLYLREQVLLLWIRGNKIDQQKLTLSPNKLEESLDPVVKSVGSLAVRPWPRAIYIFQNGANVTF